MGNYYCLMAGLPDISLEDARCKVSMAEMREQMDEVLSDKDKKIISYFFLKNDCVNLVKLLKNPELCKKDQDLCVEGFEPGNFTMEQYIDLITSAREMNFNVHRFPAFMSEFVRNYPYNKDKEGYFPEDDMLYQYYQYAIDTCPNKMISEWFQLNLDVTNILTAFLARKNGWNVADYIQGEGEVNEMILTNNTKDFSLTHEYDYMVDLMKIVECADPVEKERKIDAFKWLWWDEKTFFDIFAIEAVFAYICKIDMLTRWEKLDVEKGKETFQHIIEALRGEAQVPEEFQAKAAHIRNLTAK